MGRIIEDVGIRTEFVLVLHSRTAGGDTHVGVCM